MTSLATTARNFTVDVAVENVERPLKGENGVRGVFNNGTGLWLVPDSLSILQLIPAVARTS